MNINQYSNTGSTSKLWWAISRLVFLAIVLLPIVCTAQKSAEELQAEGFSLCKEGRYEESIALFEEAILQVTNQFGPEDSNLGSAIVPLGAVLGILGRYSEAEMHLRKAAGIFEENFGGDNLSTILILESVADMCLKQGKYVDAERIFQRTLESNEATLGSDHLATAKTTSALALLYQRMGKIQESELLHQNSLRTMEANLGLEHPDLAKPLENFATLRIVQQMFSEAEMLQRRALNICRKQYGEDHFFTAQAFANLSAIYHYSGNLKEAELNMRRALDLFQKGVGANAIELAAMLTNLGVLCRVQKKYAEAEKYSLQAFGIFENALGQHHPDTINSLNNVTLIYLSSGENGKAKSMFEKALVGTYRHQTKILSYFSEQECIKFQRTIHLDALAGTVGSGKLAAMQQLWFKGAVQEAMNRRRAVETRLLTLSEGRELLERRQALGEQLNRAVLSRGAKSESKVAMETELALIEKACSLLIEDEHLQYGAAFGLGDVQSKLRVNDTLIELFRYRHIVSVADEIVELRYGAAVIPPDGSPKFFGLGSADSINAEICKYRDQISKVMSDPENTDASVFFDAESILYRRILSVLEDNLVEGQRVILSLDSQLHFLPLHMIRDGGGVPFGKRYRVRYVASGRDLLRTTTKQPSKSALLIGHPDYRARKEEVIEGDEQEKHFESTLAENLRNGLNAEVSEVALAPLPGTEQEIQILKEMLNSKGYRTVLLSQGSATEQGFMEQCRGASIVHLATHGFFLNEIKINQSLDLGSSRGALNEQKPIQDPMYRSGLALSGAQNTFDLWRVGQIPSPSQDGILMAVEASILDLRGTDLVVLSACETGKGDAIDGEGVMGLRRAFASAGANSTIFTLWPVDDESTVDLMVAFYDKYLDGIHPSNALAEVQISMFESYIEKYGELQAIARLAPFVCMSIGQFE